MSQGSSTPRPVFLPTIEKKFSGEELSRFCGERLVKGRRGRRRDSLVRMRMVQDLSSDDLLSDFAHLHHAALCYRNANSRTRRLLHRFAPDLPCDAKQGRGRPGFLFEFEVLFLYCNGFDTKLIARLLVNLFGEDMTLMDAERMCDRCVSAAKNRDPKIAFAAAVVSKKAKDYGHRGRSRREALGALRRLGIGKGDGD
jgi:hypothetical protein